MKVNRIVCLSFMTVLAFLMIFSMASFAATKEYVRWSTQKMPLKVYIDRTSTAPGYQQSYSVDVAKAFAAWKSSSGGVVNFVFINDKNSADLIVKWTDRVAKQDKSHNQAWAITKIGNPTEIIFATKHPLQTDQSLTNNTMYMIALHEIGHSVGMWWHSRDPNDIMYADFIVASSGVKGSRIVVNKNKGSLSSRDVANLKALYQNNSVKSLDKLARNTKMSMPMLDKAETGGVSVETTGVAAATAKGTSIQDVDMGKALTILRKDPYNPEAHNNLGLAYMAASDYNKAIQSFENAINIDPYSYKAHFNLGLVYSKTGNSQSAINEYLQYLKLKPDAPNAAVVVREIQRLKTM